MRVYVTAQSLQSDIRWIHRSALFFFEFAFVGEKVFDQTSTSKHNISIAQVHSICNISSVKRPLSDY